MLNLPLLAHDSILLSLGTSPYSYSCSCSYSYSLPPSAALRRHQHVCVFRRAPALAAVLCQRHPRRLLLEKHVLGHLRRPARLQAVHIHRRHAQADFVRARSIGHGDRSTAPRAKGTLCNARQPQTRTSLVLRKPNVFQGHTRKSKEARPRHLLACPAVA